MGGSRRVGGCCVSSQPGRLQPDLLQAETLFPTLPQGSPSSILSLPRWDSPGRAWLGDPSPAPSPSECERALDLSGQGRAVLGGDTEEAEVQLGQLAGRAACRPGGPHPVYTRACVRASVSPLRTQCRADDIEPITTPSPALHASPGCTASSVTVCPRTWRLSLPRPRPRSSCKCSLEHCSRDSVTEEPIS